MTVGGRGFTVTVSATDFTPYVSDPKHGLGMPLKALDLGRIEKKFRKLQVTGRREAKIIA